MSGKALENAREFTTLALTKSEGSGRGSLGAGSDLARDAAEMSCKEIVQGLTDASINDGHSLKAFLISISYH